MMQNAYLNVVDMTPKPVAQQLRRFDSTLALRATEIRLRADKPCAIYADGKPHFLEKNSDDSRRILQAFRQNEIKDILAHMCEYSLYKKEDELKHGYITIKGGHRIGVCSTYLQNGSVDIGSISSVSIRIAREHRGCAADLFGMTMMKRLSSVLIAGPPLCGKTTILRDLSRILASRPLMKKVVLIDERGELASVYNGAPTLDTGTCSDVLDGYPRTLGFDIAVRTLSPDIIVCDELGNDDDVASIVNAGKSGVAVLATVHAREKNDLMQKASVKRCIDSGVFDYVVFLSGYPDIGKVKKVYEVKKA